MWGEFFVHSQTSMHRWSWELISSSILLDMLGTNLYEICHSSPDDTQAKRIFIRYVYMVTLMICQNDCTANMSNKREPMNFMNQFNQIYILFHCTKPNEVKSINDKVYQLNVIIFCICMFLTIFGIILYSLQQIFASIIMNTILRYTNLSSMTTDFYKIHSAPIYLI